MTIVSMSPIHKDIKMNQSKEKKDRQNPKDMDVEEKRNQKAQNQRGQNQRGQNQKAQNQKGQNQKGQNQKGQNQKAQNQKAQNQRGQNQKAQNQRGQNQKNQALQQNSYSRVWLEFGIQDKKVSKNVQKLKEGPTKFYTLIDALNYMSSKGWKYVETVVLTQEKEVVHNVFMRKKGKRKK